MKTDKIIIVAKMLRITKISTVLSLLILCFAVLPSCDDNKENDEPSNSGSIIGDWVLTGSSYIDLDEESAEFQFLPGGVLKIHYYYKGEEDPDSPDLWQYYIDRYDLTIVYKDDEDSRYKIEAKGSYVLTEKSLTYNCTIREEYYDYEKAELVDDTFKDRWVFKRKE